MSSNKEPLKTVTFQNNEVDFDFALCHGDIHGYEYCRL